MLLSLLRPLVVRIELMWGGIFLPEVARQKGVCDMDAGVSLLTLSLLEYVIHIYGNIPP